MPHTIRQCMGDRLDVRGLDAKAKAHSISSMARLEASAQISEESADILVTCRADGQGPVENACSRRIEQSAPSSLTRPSARAPFRGPGHVRLDGQGSEMVHVQITASCFNGPWYGQGLEQKANIQFLATSCTAARSTPQQSASDRLDAQSFDTKPATFAGGRPGMAFKMGPGGLICCRDQLALRLTTSGRAI